MDRSRQRTYELQHACPTMGAASNSGLDFAAAIAFMCLGVARWASRYLKADGRRSPELYVPSWLIEVPHALQTIVVSVGFVSGIFLDGK